MSSASAIQTLRASIFDRSASAARHNCYDDDGKLLRTVQASEETGLAA